MSEPNDLYLVAQAVDDLARERGLRHCHVGGLAVLQWGEARATTDVDLCVYRGFGGEDAAIRALVPEIDMVDSFERLLLLRQKRLSQ